MRSSRRRQAAEVFSTAWGELRQRSGIAVPAALLAGIHGAHQHEAGGEHRRARHRLICTRPSSRGWRRVSRASLRTRAARPERAPPLWARRSLPAGDWSRLRPCPADTVWWGSGAPPHQQGCSEVVEAQDGVDPPWPPASRRVRSREDGGQAAGQHGLARIRAGPPCRVGRRRRRSPGRASRFPAPSRRQSRGRQSPPAPGVQAAAGSRGASPPQMGRQLPHALHRVDLQPAGQSGLGGGGGGDGPLDARPPARAMGSMPTTGRREPDKDSSPT